MTSTIRPATLADADLIVQMAHQTWWPTYRSILSTEQITYMLSTIYNSDKVARQIEAGEQNYLILEADGRPQAFAAYAPRPENNTVYKLHKIYCLTAAQGKGYGTQLLNTVVNAIKANGHSVLELNVNRENPSKSFYEKLGFEVAYQEDIPIGPYWMNDYVMRKNL